MKWLPPLVCLANQATVNFALDNIIWNDSGDTGSLNQYNWVELNVGTYLLTISNCQCISKIHLIWDLNPNVAYRHYSTIKSRPDLLYVFCYQKGDQWVWLGLGELSLCMFECIRIGLMPNIKSNDKHTIGLHTSIEVSYKRTIFAYEALPASPAPLLVALPAWSWAVSQKLSAKDAMKKQKRWRFRSATWRGHIVMSPCFFAVDGTGQMSWKQKMYAKCMLS